MPDINCTAPCDPNPAAIQDLNGRSAPAPAGTQLVKFATNAADGSFLELTTDGHGNYLDSSGLDVTPIVTEAPYAIADYVTPVFLGTVPLTVTDPVVSPAPSVPDNAGFARFNVNGNDAMYSIGADPVADQSYRVANGFRVALLNRSEIDGLRLAALNAAQTFKSEFQYWNVDPDTVGKT